MIYTKEQVLTKLNEEDVQFFVTILKEDTYDNESNVKNVYTVSYGDGNELQEVLAFKFPDEALYVSIDGYYSSWDSNSYNYVSLAEPYVFTETRYRSIPLPETTDVLDWSVPKQK